MPKTALPIEVLAEVIEMFEAQTGLNYEELDKLNDYYVSLINYCEGEGSTKTKKLKSLSKKSQKTITKLMTWADAKHYRLDSEIIEYTNLLVILSNSGLILSQMAKLGVPKKDYTEILQSITIKIFEELAKFDAEKGAIGTFLGYYIKECVTKHRAQNGESGYYQSINHKIKQVLSELESESYTEPTIAQISAKMKEKGFNYGENTIKNAIMISQSAVSVDELWGVAGESISPEKAVISGEISEALHASLDNLTEFQRDIILAELAFVEQNYEKPKPKALTEILKKKYPEISVNRVKYFRNLAELKIAEHFEFCYGESWGENNEIKLEEKPDYTSDFNDFFDFEE